MIGKHEAPERIASMHCFGDRPELRYRNLKERRKVYLYNQILIDLVFHGASRMDADKAARWCRTAEPGETLQVDPGIEIVIEEAEEGE